MICIDTDILAIYHVFNRDARYLITQVFMERSKEASRAAAIFSLLEVCGVMATARQSEEAMKLFDEYVVSDDVSVTWNTKHFTGKTAINVQTPEEWLAEHSKD